MSDIFISTDSLVSQEEKSKLLVDYKERNVFLYMVSWGSIKNFDTVEFACIKIDLKNKIIADGRIPVGEILDKKYTPNEFYKLFNLEYKDDEIRYYGLMYQFGEYIENSKD